MIDFAVCLIKYHILSVLHNMDNIKVASNAGALSVFCMSPNRFNYKAEFQVFFRQGQ